MGVAGRGESCIWLAQDLRLKPPPCILKNSLLRILGALVVLAAFVFVLIEREPRGEMARARAGTNKADPKAEPAEEERDTVTATAPVVAEVENRDVLAAGPTKGEAGPLEADDLRKSNVFHDWTKRWMSADAAGREGMRAEGLRLAQERRPAMKRMIRHDPRLALEQAVPRVVRQDLPAEIVEQLEKPVSATGEFKVYRGMPQRGAALAPGTELTLRYFDVKERSYKARVFGEMEKAQPHTGVPLRGVAIDREFAVEETAVRRLEPGERVAAGATVKDTCPVSGRSTPVDTSAGLVADDAQPMVEVGGELIRLCNGTHVRVMDEQYTARIMASGVAGAEEFPDTQPGGSANAIGNFRCLYMRVTYPDQLREPNTEASAQGDMRNVSRFYLENSYGKMTTTTVVTPLLVLPHTKAWYVAKDDEVDGLGLVHSHARAEARRLGYDAGNNHCYIVRVNSGPRLDGISWGGGSSVWVSWDGMDVLNHECGHSLGLGHANFWETTDGTPYGAGSNEEYGNPYDVMGNGSGFGAHYHPQRKRGFGWLPDKYVHLPGVNGRYRLHPYDQPTLEEGKRYTLRTAKDTRNYYLEYHPAVGLTNQVMVLFDSRLIDTTVNSPGGKGDGGIAIGRTFSDYDADLHFTTVSKNATVPPSMDVVMNRGPFPGNQKPVIASLQATATSIAVNGSITFTATASDPDGDELAYHWDFSDNHVPTNAAVLTRTFTATDQMTVMLTVSDMKGGVARKHVVVTIGNPGRQVVTGNISNGGQPVTGVLVQSDNGKYCYTDTEGNYALSDLQTGSRTLEASAAGYTFTPGFANPLTIVAGTNTANWTASSLPAVTVAAGTAATEGGAAGTFVLSRTGSTAAALEVNFAPATGTAALTTDYTMTPSWGTSRVLTIPAGQAALTVNIAAVNDTTQEGPEIAALQVATGTGYVVRGQGLAHVTIQDNDTSLPQVSIAATDGEGAEEGGDPMEFTVTRTGATANALTVMLTPSGTATAGSDYPGINSVVIPSGQTSAKVTIVPVDDVGIESTEECTITIAPNAAYIRNASAQAATGTITDDETPVVSVTALDAAASEAGRDPGVFLLTRTGSTGAALKVYYGLSGRALHGTDYVAVTGDVTIPAGAASAPVMITPYDDALGENSESVTLSVATYDNVYNIGQNWTATVDIADNDLPQVRVASTATANEPSTNGSFTIAATSSGTGSVAVKYTISGTATSGVDFTARTGTVSVPVNGTATVSVPVINDGEAEEVETVVLTLTPDAAYGLFNDTSAIVRIRDDEAPVMVAVSAWQTSPAEPGSTSRFYLSRNTTAGALAVSYAMSGTATNGTDYATLSGTAVIPDGAAGVDVTVTPTDDGEVEGTESIVMTLSPGAGYSIEVPQGTLQLGDNETPPITLGFQTATGATTEAADGTTGQFRDIPVTLSAAATVPVSVEYSAAPGSALADDVDWTLVDAANGNAPIGRGTLTFAPGVTTMNVRVRIRDDGVIEGAENAVIELRNANDVRISTSRDTHTLTISDANNTGPRASLLIASSTRSEADIREPMLMAVLDAPSPTSVTVNFSTSGTATAGSDYTLSANSAVIPAGQQFLLLPLTLVADAVPETSETIVVTLTGATGATLGTRLTHTITLTESNQPIVGISAQAGTIAESGATSFTISRTGSTAVALTVNYAMGGTATNTTDYATLPGSVTMAIGQSSAQIALTPVDDLVEEENETVTLTIDPSPNYALGTTTEATVTMLDDDAAPVIAIAQPLRSTVFIPPGVGMLVRAEATRTGPGGVENVPVTWSMVSGPGTAVFDGGLAGSIGVTFPANGTYVLRASANHGPATVTKDLTVGVGLTLVNATIGSTTAPGSLSEALDGTITVSGAGAGLSASGTSDGFHFVATPVTGDFDLAVRIVSVTNPGGDNSCRFGIMARATATANAPYAMSLHRGNGVHAIQARLTAGTNPYDSTGGTQYTMPRWVRLVRVGDDFTAYYSDDGEAWSQRGTTQNIPAMGATPLVGLAVTSAAPATASTVIFDNLSLALPVNAGPNVNAGPPLNATGPWTLDGTVIDDGRPAPAALTTLWQYRSGPAVPGFAGASSADTGVTFSASGNYVLRLTASDGVVTTFDETSGSVTVMTAFQAWRAEKFGAEAGNPAIAGEMVDHELDGVVNLVEYAMDLDPHAPSQGMLPTISLDASNVYITWRRNKSATDVTVEFETAPGMTETWTPVTPVDTVLSDNGEVEVIRSAIPRSGETMVVRLVVGVE